MNNGEELLHYKYTARCEDGRVTTEEIYEKIKSKPPVDDAHYSTKCPKCLGTGIFVYGFTEVKKGPCFRCKETGWLIYKKPKHSKHRSRPIAGQMDYGIFCYLLKMYLLSWRGNKCEGCGTKYKNQAIAKEKLEMHHIVPRKDGGNDDDDNLLLLCESCHQSKHDFPIGRQYGKLAKLGR